MVEIWWWQMGGRVAAKCEKVAKFDKKNSKKYLENSEKFCIFVGRKSIFI